MKIIPIVEGYGEVDALPVLLRRFQEESESFALGIGRPIRRHRHQLVHESDVRKAVRLALLDPDCAAILIVLDADDDCPAELAPSISAWASEEAPQVPSAVVLACREFETWFLASLESLRGNCRIRADAVSPVEPEAIRGAKETLESFMVPGASYSETVDQPRMAASFSFSQAYSRSRSFRKLAKAFGHLLSQVGMEIPQWPPSAWT